MRSMHLLDDDRSGRRQARKIVVSIKSEHSRVRCGSCGSESMSSGKKCQYEPGAWVDLARGLLDSKTCQQMTAHLDTGCVECGELARFFVEVARRATADAACKVPDYAVHNI